MKVLKFELDCGKIKTNPEWLMCPACGRGKVLKLLPDTRGEKIVVHCKVCKQESVVNIPFVPVP
jgi:transcription elongation factor Elf1